MALSDEDGLNLWRMIGRIRRAMPRNADVMAVCDALEQSLRDVTEPAPSHMTAPNVTDCPVCVERTPSRQAPQMTDIEQKTFAGAGSSSEAHRHSARGHSA